MYIGGPEHAVLHLLYVRFLAMVFHDCGMLHFSEPFLRFRSHGLITKDGAKMSKSRGNVVSPDEYIRIYGADAVRMYLAFIAPFEQGGDFQDHGIKGMTRFLDRVWKFWKSNLENKASESGNKKISILLHQTIKKVTEDIETLHYNTAISSLMILLNVFEESPRAISKQDMQIFLKLLAPFAPHITEEMWQETAPKKKIFTSIHNSAWPLYDKKIIQAQTYTLIVQVNGKVRAKVSDIRIGASELDIKDSALQSVRAHIAEKPKKVIFIKDRLINFVV
jgi:leucyl-tRNA synthetase